MSSTEPEPHSSEDDGYSSTKSQQRSRMARVKRKVKKVIARGVERVIEQDHSKDSSLAITKHDPAFHPETAAKVEMGQDALSNNTSGSTMLQKTKQIANSVTTALVNPKEAAKQSIAKKMSSMHPHTLPTNSKALLQAYEEEEDYGSESVPSSEEAYEQYKSRQTKRTRRKSRLQKFEAQRQSMQVAWSLGHVDRVKAVVTSYISYPEYKDCYTIDASGRRKTDHLSWFGRLALWYTQNFAARYIDSFTDLPFSTNTFRGHAERLIMASGPIQVWAMDIRSIYRWENPQRTGRWFLTWLILWYFEYLISFFWAFTLYHTLKNKLSPRSKENLQESIERTMNHEGVTFQFGEFIDRHGKDDWIAPFLDQMGPYIQLQVNDLADYLEILTNFYMWRSPSKTLASLAFFASCLAISVLTDFRFAYRIFWFIVGSTFFLCWPIASRYPRYRLLVSGWRWTLWGIPTNSEWGFDYLRQQCEKVRQNAEAAQIKPSQSEELLRPPIGHTAGISHNKTGTHRVTDDEVVSASSLSDPLQDLLFLSFRCRYQGTRGRLNFTSDGLHFVRSIKHKCLWSLKYSDIDEMRKYHKLHMLDATTSSKAGSKNKDNRKILELQDKDNNLFTLDFKGGRDEAFNYVVGFSRVQWKSLQS